MLDTNTCISVMRGEEETVLRINQVSSDDCVVSVITTFELFTGLNKCARPAQESIRLERFFTRVRELDFNSAAAREASKIRAVLEKSGGRIGPYDTLLAGHARSLGLTLVTENHREFSRVPDLAIDNWKSR